MRNIFNINWIQRIIYTVVLIVLFLLSFRDGIDALNQKSSFGIKYWYFFIIPGLILLIQIIYNSIYGWFALLMLYIAYFIGFVLRLTLGFIDKGDYYGLTDYIILMIIIFVLLISGYLLYKMKPVKNPNSLQPPPTP